jgi:ATP-binding cassette subfamily C protein/ATP-binding cassette subfamily C protein EexD
LGAVAIPEAAPFAPGPEGKVMPVPSPTVGTQTVLGGSRPAFIAAALFSLFANLLMLVIPLFSLQIYDRVLASRSGETLAMLTLIATLALVVQALLEGARSRLMVHVGLWLERRWAPELLERAIRRGPANGPGINLIRDISTLRGFIGGPGIFHLFDSPWVPIYAFAMFMLHPSLGWLTLFGGLALFAVTLAGELSTRGPFRDANRGFNNQLIRAYDYIRRSEVIESMGMVPGIVALWRADHQAAEQALATGWFRSSALSALARFGRLGVQITVMAVGAWLAIDDKLTPGAVVAGSILLARALAPVESLVGSWKGFVEARTAARHLNEELASPPPARTTTRLPVPSGRLVLDAVSFEIDGNERPILSEVAFDLPAGESLGIIGPSAAGKSTLARIILGLQTPTLGRARLDEADVATWNREDLGRHIGYLPQDIELFPGTVKQNIARMGTANDDEVIAAAQLAGVHEMVLRLPLGYDTEIADIYRNLSGGQRQRVAIARAFYGTPRLIVLDEPNSNLDAEGENALIRALIRARERQITTVVIAHRARVLMTVDRLLLLRDGKLELMGPRDEVMARVLPPPTSAEQAVHNPMPVREATR